MTGRERMQMLLQRELPDRYGLYEHFWPETLRDYWPKQGYPVNVHRQPVNPVDYFGYDLEPAGGDIDTVPRRGYLEVVAETEAWRVTRDGRGAVLKHWKSKSGTPEHIDFAVTTPAKWEEYKEYLTDFDPGRLDIEGTKLALDRVRGKGKFATFGCLIFFELLRATLGDVCMLENLLLDPKWIHDFNLTYLNFFKEHYDYLFREAGLPDGMFIYEDLAFSNGLFCSPTTYRELIWPYHRELFDFFHSYGLPVIFHSCGDVRKAMPSIVEAGIDCLQPLEAKAGCDIVQLAAEFRDRIAFMGNIDVTVLNTNNKQAIREEIEGKLAALKQMGAAYVFHSDHSIPPDVTFATYKYALEIFAEVSRL